MIGVFMYDQVLYILQVSLLIYYTQPLRFFFFNVGLLGFLKRTMGISSHKNFYGFFFVLNLVCDKEGGGPGQGKFDKKIKRTPIKKNQRSAKFGNF